MPWAMATDKHKERALPGVLWDLLVAGSPFHWPCGQPGSAAELKDIRSYRRVRMKLVS